LREAALARCDCWPAPRRILGNLGTTYPPRRVGAAVADSSMSQRARLERRVVRIGAPVTSTSRRCGRRQRRRGSAGQSRRSRVEGGRSLATMTRADRMWITPAPTGRHLSAEHSLRAKGVPKGQSTGRLSRVCGSGGQRSLQSGCAMRTSAFCGTPGPAV